MFRLEGRRLGGTPALGGSLVDDSPGWAAARGSEEGFQT